MNTERLNSCILSFTAIVWRVSVICPRAALLYVGCLIHTAQTQNLRVSAQQWANQTDCSRLEQWEAWNKSAFRGKLTLHDNYNCEPDYFLQSTFPSPGSRRLQCSVVSCWCESTAEHREIVSVSLFRHGQRESGSLSFPSCTQAAGGRGSTLYNVVQTQTRLEGD